MCICVSKEAGCGEHVEDGRSVYTVSVRIHPKRDATRRKGIMADPFLVCFYMHGILAPRNG